MPTDTGLQLLFQAIVKNFDRSMFLMNIEWCDGEAPQPTGNIVINPDFEASTNYSIDENPLFLFKKGLI